MAQEHMDAATFRRTFCNEPFPAKKQGRKVTKADRSKLEDAFLAAWRVVAKDLPMPDVQHKFCETRRWRFDFCWEYLIFGSFKLAVEINGGSFVQGRHNRGASQEKDNEKLREAAKLGWTVLVYGTSAMKDPYKVAAEVAEVLRQRITQTA